MPSKCVGRSSINLVPPGFEAPALFAAPPRSRTPRGRPLTVQSRALSVAKSAAVPVPATLSYGIVSAFRCLQKTYLSHPFSSVFGFTFHASTGETHGRIRRCTEDAQRQRGQVRR